MNLLLRYVENRILALLISKFASVDLVSAIHCAFLSLTHYCAKWIFFPHREDPFLDKNYVLLSFPDWCLW